MATETCPNIKRTFFVTGGCGYVGFHIAKQLIQLGHKVVLYDINNLSDVWDPSYTVACGEHSQIYFPYGCMKFVKGDITDLDLLAKSTRDVDCIFHTGNSN